LTSAARALGTGMARSSWAAVLGWLAVLTATACENASEADTAGTLNGATTGTPGATTGTDTSAGTGTSTDGAGGAGSGAQSTGASSTTAATGTTGGVGGATTASSTGAAVTLTTTSNTTGGMPAECQGAFDTPALDGAMHTVSVDAANSWGELPHFWNTYGIGHLGLFLQEDRGWGETLKTHLIDGVQNLGLTSIRAHGLFHEDIGIYHEEAGVPVYDFTRSDQIFDFLVSQGVKPIVELGAMPRDLARDPSETWFDWEMGISPPKDFALWQELVFEFVEHSVEKYGADVVNEWYFEVWNEPECCRGQFWTGTLDEYFELYDHAAEGVRRALPTGRVGGPVASQPLELTDNSELGIKFLDHVTTDNYVHPGSPGVLDFFAYHSWSFIEGAVDGYFQGLDLLDSYGFNDVRIAITEFGPTWEFNLHDEPQEMHQGAAFVAQTYADISRRAAQEGKRFPSTYAWWVLSDIFQEDQYREDDPFIGCMGLISRENIRKPAYNAYHFLAQMGAEQIPLTVSGAGGVGGMAARSSNGAIQILLYNGQNPGEGPADDTYYAVTEAQSIGVNLAGLDPALAYDVTVYRVDESHGNAYATWEAQGRPSMSTMTEENWQALRDTMDSPPEALGEALCGETFAANFELSSPGVLFVTLNPALR